MWSSNWTALRQSRVSRTRYHILHTMAGGTTTPRIIQVVAVCLGSPYCTGLTGQRAGLKKRFLVFAWWWQMPPPKATYQRLFNAINLITFKSFSCRPSVRLPSLASQTTKRWSRREGIEPVFLRLHFEFFFGFLFSLLKFELSNVRVRPSVCLSFFFGLSIVLIHGSMDGMDVWMQQAGELHEMLRTWALLWGLLH